MDRPAGSVIAIDGSIGATEVLKVALQKAVAEAGGLGGLVHLRGSAATPGLELAASCGLPATFTRQWQHLRDHAAAAPAAAVRLGRPMWCPSPQGPGTGMMSVPMRAAQGEGVGALTVVTAGDEPTPGEQEVMQSLAGWAADLLLNVVRDDAPAHQRKAGPAAAERAAGRRAVRIQELTAALAEAVTTQDVLAAVAERVLPPFRASGAIIEVAENDHLRVIGTVGYPAPFVNQMNGYPLAKIPSITAALHGHQPIFLSSPAEYAERFPEAAGWPDRSGKQAWAFLPLVVSGQEVGMCVVSFDRPRHLTGAERALLIALSGLVAQALERARLFDAEHARAQEFQRALLPRELPSPPALTAAARYLPAGPGTNVGGDWYDVIPLSADRVALVIGDVMGHGLPEAVIMGRLRTAVQTLSDLELPPDEVLAHLNDLVSGLGEDTFATCLYAIYDPITGICTFARAGHPPPAFAWPDGTVEFAQAATDPPLGVAEPPFETVQLPIPDNSLLILYTDGLIEPAEADITTGMSRLAEFLRLHHGQNLDHLCDGLTQALLPADQRRTDDAALLVVQVHRTASDAIATWSLPEDPLAARAARRHVRQQLAAWRLEELAPTTEMLANELVANVIRHARGPMQLRLLLSQTLVCEVFDGSLTTPRIRRAAWTDEGGRGLQLIAALSDRWGTRYMATGKCIWTEQLLP